MKVCALKPCLTCPWRKTSTVGGADIVGFDLEMMRGLSKTVPSRGSDRDGFFQIMACHHSKEGEEFACAGYIARHGEQNLNVRLMAATKQIDLPSLVEACSSIDLYDNFFEMLDEYESLGS